MDKLKLFYEIIDKEMGVNIATAADGRVSMRLISPVLYEGAILIFTFPDSKKYHQLRVNPHCCIAAGSMFMEADAEFLGASMQDGNEKYRLAYEKKFPNAFDEDIEFGGRDCEFILLRPRRLSGWSFENDAPTADGVPTVPFELEL